MKHLLVTNDFPPKHGGIQSYLWELWRRLDPESFVVVTHSHPGSEAFDADQRFRTVRLAGSVKPDPAFAKAIRELGEEVSADLVVFDPAFPLAIVGPYIKRPYALVLHGAEATVPSRLPGTRQLLAHIVRQATGVIAAGSYPAEVVSHIAGESCPPVVVIPPGVDCTRFRPLDDPERALWRQRWLLPNDSRLVVSVSRLVPRKGMDVLIDVAAQLSASRPDLSVAIAGKGRDRGRLALRILRGGAPVRLLGEVTDLELPYLYGCADVFAMLCRDRWMSLEQEGFGIVFLEAAACGIPQVAGDSGGASDAVAHGETGLVVRRPHDLGEVSTSLTRLLDDQAMRSRMGQAARVLEHLIVLIMGASVHSSQQASKRWRAAAM